MKIVTLGLIATGVLGLAACNNTPQENMAANVEQTAENQADYYDDMAGNTSNDMVADNLSNTADMIRDQGENQADAIENGAVPVNGM